MHDDRPLCECGHRGPDHNQWWDVDEGCGMGCDLCDCGDVRFVASPNPSGRT